MAHPIFCFFILSFLLILGCARSPIYRSEQALRIASPPSQLTDDKDFEGLVEMLQVNIEALKVRYPDTASPMRFGTDEISVGSYIASLEGLLRFIEAHPNQPDTWGNYLLKNFQFYEVYGKKRWGDVFVTAYFEPVLKGSHKPKDSLTQPLYGVPDDLVMIHMDRFAANFPQWNLFSNLESNFPRKLFGRVETVKQGQPAIQIVPYWSRAEIDQGNKLKQQEPLAYVDPIEAFFLQIQGSGTVEFSDGESMRVGYAAQNGHRYVAIGRYLFDVIDREEMSLHAIEQHLRSLSEEKRAALLDRNPSYVFFRKLEGRPETSFGAEVVDGRTIATDPRFFPKGAIALLEFPKPIFYSSEDSQPSDWTRVQRMVVDHDTGGAIRGPHRVDLFWGRGSLAKQAAGVMRHQGRLLYLAPVQK